jgi:hypothetical protein
VIQLTELLGRMQAGETWARDALFAAANVELHGLAHAVESRSRSRSEIASHFRPVPIPRKIGSSAFFSIRGFSDPVRSEVLVQRRAYRTVIIEHEPFDHRQWQGTIADQLIVEGAEAKVRALAVAIAAEQSHDLPLAGDVRDLL